MVNGEIPTAATTVLTGLIILTGFLSIGLGVFMQVRAIRRSRSEDESRAKTSACAEKDAAVAKAIAETRRESETAWEFSQLKISVDNMSSTIIEQSRGTNGRIDGLANEMRLMNAKIKEIERDNQQTRRIVEEHIGQDDVVDPGITSPD